jgi:methylmalonyl-CoA epimerase
VSRLNHVNIAAPDAAAMAERFRSILGLSVTEEETVSGQGVRVLKLATESATVEITEPLAPDTPVGRFLAKRGTAIHHLAFEVEDIEATLDRLKAEGIALVDESPRPGASGHRIAFVHPKSFGGILVELVER